MARQAFLVARKPALDGGDDRLAPFRALEAFRQRTERGQTLDRGRRLDRDIGDEIVLQHAPARDVACARLALAPGRDLDQHGQFLRLAHARAQPLPGIFRFHPVGFGRGKDIQLLAQDRKSVV